MHHPDSRASVARAILRVGVVLASTLPQPGVAIHFAALKFLVANGVHPQMTRFLGVLALGAALVLSAAPALAHSTVKSTVPVSGSVVNRSPESIFINFNEPARMTSVVVAQSGKPDRKLEFTPPSGSTTTIRVPAPTLASGRNEIKWKALSKDGHPISGSIIITVQGGATSSGDEPSTPGEHNPH